MRIVSKYQTQVGTLWLVNLHSQKSIGTGTTSELVSWNIYLNRTWIFPTKIMEHTYMASRPWQSQAIIDRYFVVSAQFFSYCFSTFHTGLKGTFKSPCSVLKSSPPASPYLPPISFQDWMKAYCENSPSFWPYSTVSLRRVLQELTTRCKSFFWASYICSS